MAEYARNEVLKLARSWIGKSVKDNSYKEIIDIYNSYKGASPRGLKMQYGWSWCACTWSALAIKLGYTDIMPIEISCGYLVEAAKKMGVWVENDKYVPKPGDAILYDWQDSGSGDNIGWPDHVGVVESVNKSAGYFVVIEGNYDNAVKRRTVSINGKYIRGFITPKYTSDYTDTVAAENQSLNEVARAVIAGTWGSGDKRKAALEAAGYNYEEVQKMVNQILNGSAPNYSNQVQSQMQPTMKKVTATCNPKKVSKEAAGTYKTTENLYCRNDAGTNKKAICVIPKNTSVTTDGRYTAANGVNWLYVQVILDGILYTGFCSSVYLKKS